MEEDTRPQWGVTISKFFIIPQRALLSIMGFLAIFNAYTMRICLSVTLTQLVLPRNYTKEQMKGVCEQEEDHTPSTTEGGGIYDWSQELQGYILGAFYVGYLITHLPGGILADKYGAKYVLSLGILSTAFFTLLTPWSIVETGPWGLLALRIGMGLGEGTTFPALATLLAQWVPLKERGILGALVLGGGQIGTIVGNAVSGMILERYHWSTVFYVMGGMAIIWFFLFILLCYNDPSSHPFIKLSEIDYLRQEMGHTSRRRNLITPWVEIFTSLPMLGLICAQIGHDWGFYVMATDLPKYMNDVLQMPIKKNGIYSSLPFLMMWFTSILSGVYTDVIISKGWVGITAIRKFNTTLAAWGPGLFMMLASYAGCDILIVVVLFTICMGLMGPYYAGMKLTPLDMSPNFSGTLMAITNGIGSIMGFLSPSVVGLMTPNTTMLEWRMVFWISFFILFITAILYCLWATGEVQSWNEPKEAKDEA